ncbi:inactive serine/threonine-protein kinase PLK5 isoform X4 [Heterocephalus glaber]|uniref:Serine/threonine-protein kinase PLK n=1 Tax=Heterocephalus glaber TaxID=10181 RepID=A0AAX6RX87_HETGA|nr:inactive serine/threonine-protein kinase PLK5 isoform X4 [Heterocephalus glaber]
MEPKTRRRRRSRQLVATFLRDPGSGRVYRRGKLIGKGAFSCCYKLTDMSTNTVFALKVVPCSGGGAGRLCPKGKVEREIALHSSLRHPNIVAFHGHFADHDHVYMVLEYCGRQSLAHLLKVRQTLTEPEVRYYLRGVVSGLRYLHQRRIVHRDLKLSNFFLNNNMEVKIGDLGLAARVGPGGRCHRVLCGTPNFLAPEVVSRNGHTCQSDIWALGCILYMVLTGSPPFPVGPLSEMYQNIRTGLYPEPTHLSPNARHLIARLLAPNPAERPSLDRLLQDNFFTQGFTPERLPPRSCHSPPNFTIPRPLGSLFRKVGRLLLAECRPPPTQDPPGEQRPVLWAPKWVDYSSKYGFGYQLSDGGSGVLFRDGTHMALRPPGGQVCYLPTRGKLETFAPRYVPSQLGAKLAVLRLFTCYMERQLREEGPPPAPQLPAAPDLCLLRFFVSPQVLLLLFSDGTMQASFSGAQAHLGLSGAGEDLLLTLEEAGRPRVSNSLHALHMHGFSPAARQRLRFALQVLQSS